MYIITSDNRFGIAFDSFEIWDKSFGMLADKLDLGKLVTELPKYKEFFGTSVVKPMIVQNGRVRELTDKEFEHLVEIYKMDEAIKQLKRELRSCLDMGSVHWARVYQTMIDIRMLAKDIHIRDFSLGW